MSSRCKSCGGSVIYDIAAKDLKCIYCDMHFNPDTYQDEKVDASEQKDYETTVFSCPNCGAQIEGEENSAMDYCLFCGSFVTLESQIKKIKKPEYILPFEVTREECKMQYRHFIAGKLYAPKEFRQDRFLEGFKGIYIPYWIYKYTFGPDIVLHGHKEEEKKGYIYNHNFQMNFKVDGSVDHVIMDASSSFDDAIGAKIAPYSEEKMKPYNPAYMFGFYGDTADLEAEVYDEEFERGVEEAIWKKVTKNKELAKGYPDENAPKDAAKKLKLKKTTSLSMFPVWFLTWKKEDRVAYSVMNGETGEVFGEIPVDIKRYLCLSLLTAIPIFLLLNTSITFTASKMLGLAMALAFFMIMAYVFLLDRIVRKTMHTDDKGFLEKHQDMKKISDEQVTNNVIVDCFESILETLKEGGIFYLIIAAAVIFFSIEFLFIGLAIVIVGTPIYTIHRLRKDARILKEKGIWLDVSGSMFSIIFGSLCLLVDPAPDMPYYICACVCMLGVAFAAIRIMKRYNQLVTRPVPHFFDRKGAERL